MGLLLCNCSSDPMGDYPVESEGGPQYYISLNLNFYSADYEGTRSNSGEEGTRANPNGGEEGDGREDALSRENAIGNLYLLIYNALRDGYGEELYDPLNDVVSYDESAKTEVTEAGLAASIHIRKVIKIENLKSLATFSTGDVTDPRRGSYLIPVRGWEPTEGDRILVYANSTQDLTQYEGRSLASLRDLRPAVAWSGATPTPPNATIAPNATNATIAPKTATNFSMATARTNEPERSGVNGRGDILTVGGRPMVNGKIYFRINEGTGSNGSTASGTSGGNTTDSGVSGGNSSSGTSGGNSPGSTGLSTDGTREVTGFPTDPFFVSATIERTAARIDFWYHGQSRKTVDGIGDSFVYDVNDDSGQATGDKVYITHIRTFNVAKSPSYWFKHVTDGTDNLSLLKYCRSEKPERGIPANFVVEPTTISGKGDSGWSDFTSKDLPATDFSVGETAESIFSENYRIDRLLENGDVIYTDAVGNANSGGTWRSLIIDYASENTVDEAQKTGEFDESATGIIFRAVYRPAKVYTQQNPEVTSAATSGENTEDSGENAEDSVENGEVADQNGSSGNSMSGFVQEEYESGTTFWSAPEGGNETGVTLFFKTQADALAYLGGDNENNRSKIHEYKDGVRYYRLRILHANTDTDEAIPMCYAIVRNNIYRVAVAFGNTGIMRPSIYVRKWNKREHHEIVM